MNMTDFHTHILPRMDDGAASSSESVDMVSELVKQNVNTIVLSPHYYSHREPITDFLKRRAASFEHLKRKNTVDVSFKLGAEVYLSEYLFNIKDITPLCIADSRTLLLELPYNRVIDDSVIDSVDRIISEFAVHPVIAHVERYPSLMRSAKLLEQLINYGCTLQVNLSSCATFGNRKVLSLFKNDYIGAIGTDAHNMGKRPPNYLSGYTRLQRILKEEKLEEIQRSMNKLLAL